MGMSEQMSKIVEEVKLESASDRNRVTLYLSKSVYREFRKCCGDVAVSRVIEKMLKAFTEQRKGESV